MAESLNAVVKTVALQVVFLFAALWGGSTWAQEMRDPTRPPAFESVRQENSAAVPSGPVLQSVLISPGRKVVIINGQTLTIGEKFGDLQVVRITESEVVLKNGTNVQTLKLFPNLEKKLTSSRSQVNVRRQ